MKTGAEDKKKVAILIGLLAVVIPVAIWELHGTFNSPAPSPRPLAPAPAALQPARANGEANARTGPNAAAATTTPEAERVTNSGIDPALHMDKLVQSEDVDYEGTGRNIFSADSAPVRIPEPIKSARGGPDQPNVTPPSVAEPPHPPAIDLKYFGYEQAKDKSIRAFIIRGDDIFMAHSGEIIDHRYKVDSISAVNIQVTDLAYNNTQTLPLSQQ